MLTIGLFPGATALVTPSPKNLIKGVNKRALRTPPAIMIELIFGPMMYPTPSNSGEISAEIEPPFSGAPNIFSGVSFQSLKADIRLR
jgi:hypothetical protein